ncbi:MAG: AAA family ATPase [Coriobacteriales bacterium]|jgi:AAA+ ATPase superfamily predicted ATPase|nr:AAA family ATPase [Coriobacteriales bacterium]
MQAHIVGREKEISALLGCYGSSESEFVAIYGRRRVGKTYLVKELFSHELTFLAEGILEEGHATQLQNFNDELANHGGVQPPAKDWLAAFNNLARLIEASPAEGKKVVFLDEVSSMCTANSGFLAALAHFWNRWASPRRDVLLIVCGSATSWIVKNIVGDKGGLHNRITRSILLQPFTLRECEDFYQRHNIRYTRYQIVEAYMVFGGIPYYMRLMRPQFSLQQNVDALYFEDGAPLRDEYEHLFRSLFTDAGRHVRIVEALATNGKGLMRKEIARQTGLPNSGRLTELLQELIQCGFVREYLYFGQRKRDRLYQLIDPFSIFHLRFAAKQRAYTSDYWLHFSTTPAHGAWSGFAFERVCLWHVPQIKHALGISGVHTEVSAWRSRSADPGAQIDLVIDRADSVINLCEAKYASGAYGIDKTESQRLREKRGAFMAETGTRKLAHITMITTFGLKRNAYAGEILFQLTLDDLFG